MVEISNLWVHFCFSAIGALLYEKILKIQLLGWMSSKFEISTIALTDKTDIENTFLPQSADVFC